MKTCRQILLVRDDGSDRNPMLVHLHNELLQLVSEEERELYRLVDSACLKGEQVAAVIIEPTILYRRAAISALFPLTTKVDVCNFMAYATGDGELLKNQIDELLKSSRKPPRPGKPVEDYRFMNELAGFLSAT